MGCGLVAGKAKASENGIVKFHILLKQIRRKKLKLGVLEAESIRY
jgi:hypothetical protein